jgi:membrane protease YdiL (CAAX protease family)
MGVLISAATITQFLLAIFLAIVGPVWDYFDTLKLRAHPSGKARLGYYRRTMLWLWTAACIALVTPGWHALFTLRGAGIQIAGQKWAWWTTASLLALVILVQLVLPVVQVTLKYRNRAFLEPRQFESMRFFLPAARLERRWFAALCVTAGFCEELLFRGFLLRFMHGAPLRLGILWAIWPAPSLSGEGRLSFHDARRAGVYSAFPAHWEPAGGNDLSRVIGFGVPALLEAEIDR